MKRYKVVGPLPILDHQPGETFQQEVPADLEKFLLGTGGLAVVSESKPKDEKATKSADSL
jgi:hypothetical protein